MSRPKTLEEVIERVIALEDDVKEITTSTKRVETALVGEWNTDGTYRDGWIQIQQHAQERQAKMAETQQHFIAKIGSIAIAVLTGLLIFAAENWYTLHTALTVNVKGH